MSAYAHQMERQFSARSLSSREGSGAELGSRYVMESGFFITSFAAIIFIAALVTAGVSLVTLLISLTVMLQSCQNQNTGIVEKLRLSGDYSYCRAFALHAELNGLKADEFPSVCRTLSIEYIQQGHYTRDLNYSVWIAESYFNNVKPLDGGLDVVMMDIDEFLPQDPQHTTLFVKRFCKYDCISSLEEARHLKKMMLLRLYIQLQARSWPIILLSRKPERQRNATEVHLKSAGFHGWSGLIMRSNDEMHVNSCEYFSRKRTAMGNAGFHIAGIISSQMDAIMGPYSQQRIFKLPNLMVYDFGNPCASTQTSEYPKAS